MQLVYFYHRHALHKLAKHPDFRFFELAIWFHTVAHSLIAVFVPIILYKTGYSISNIIIFYLIFNLFDIPLNFAVAELMRKIGARYAMILGTLATIAFFGLLGFLPPNNWLLLILLAFLAAAYDTLFWVSHIYIFIEANREKLDSANSVGSLEGVRSFANVVGPLVGAVILIFLGQVLLVIASIMIFVISFIPLFKMRHVRDLPNEEKLSFRKFFSDPQEKKNYLSLSLLGIHSEVDGTLWPLFIFTVFGTIASVAAIPIIVSLSTALFSYLAGKLTKQYETRMIIVGSLIIAGAWILRLTLPSTPLYFTTVFLMAIFSLLVSIPLDSSITQRGLQIGSLASATYRNAAGMVLRVPLYIALIILVDVFKISFVLAASSLFAIILVMFLLNSKKALVEPSIKLTA